MQTLFLMNLKTFNRLHEGANGFGKDQQPQFETANELVEWCYDNHHDHLIGTAMSVFKEPNQAKDAVQAFYEWLLTHEPVFLKVRDISLQEEGSVSGYLKKTAYWFYRDEIKRKQAKQFTPLPPPVDGVTFRSMFESEVKIDQHRDTFRNFTFMERMGVEKEYQFKQLEALIPKLKQQYQRVISMRHSRMSMSHKEIGEELGISENAAKNRYARACDKLRKMIAMQKQ